jgi:hypothetical protein
MITDGDRHSRDPSFIVYICIQCSARPCVAQLGCFYTSRVTQHRSMAELPVVVFVSCVSAVTKMTGAEAKDKSKKFYL